MFLPLRYRLLHRFPVISNSSSDTPEHSFHDVSGLRFGNFLEVAKSKNQIVTL